MSNKVINSKCPKCGSNDLTLDDSSAELVCNYCGFRFEGEKYVESVTDLNELSGTKISSGASDIDKSDDKPLAVLQCSNCGAEVIVNLGEEYARCHWCRTVLSSSEVIDRLRVPDQVLPFSISKEKAKELATDYISKRSKYAKVRFKKDFNIDNILGV